MSTVSQAVSRRLRTLARDENSVVWALLATLTAGGEWPYYEGIVFSFSVNKLILEPAHRYIRSFAAWSCVEGEKERE